MPYCQAVLRQNFPKVPIYDDITKIKWGEVPKVDVLTGGFPCQDISNAGKRKGITGEKSSLWKEFARAISVLRPRVVFIENVSALLGRGMHVVLCDLASLGYDAQWHCVTASSVGAPHRRDRVFIIATNTRGGGSYEEQCAQGVSETGGLVVMENPECVESSREVSNADEFGLEGQVVQQGLHVRQQKTRISNSSSKRCEKDGKFCSERKKWFAECSEVSNPDGSRFKELIQSEKRRLCEFRETVGRQQWEIEPNVGERVDGFPNMVVKK